MEAPVPSSTPPPADTRAATVQHVTKKSSDELLRKFAQVGSDDDGRTEAKKLSKRLKRSVNRGRKEIKEGDDEACSVSYCESPAHALIVERKRSLDLLARKSALLRQLGMGRSQIRARDLKNRSFLVAIEKTWRKTLEGASKVLLEKHYNRHRRLINDVV